MNRQERKGETVPAKTYAVSVTFTDMTADSILDAAKITCKWIMEDGKELMYDVTDEETDKKYSVDLSTSDEDAVEPY